MQSMTSHITRESFHIPVMILEFTIYNIEFEIIEKLTDIFISLSTLGWFVDYTINIIQSAFVIRSCLDSLYTSHL